MAKRYSEKQKAKLLEKYSLQRKSGSTTVQAAKKVGVTYATILNWQKKPSKPKGKKNTTAILNKAVARPRGRKATNQASQKSNGGMALVTPNGYRIEGITPKELIQVLKTLK